MERFWHLLTFDEHAPLLFSSGLFLFFFLGFMVVYYFTHENKTARVWWVTLFSLYFYYKCAGIYWVLHIILVVVDFHLAREMERSKTRAGQRSLLAISLVVNLGMLAYFKYTNYFAELWNAVMNGHLGPWDIILPAGISFFTFQSLSYTIDVYRGQLKALDDIMDYAFFVTFFPQMVAGPIVRAADFLPQINRPVVVTRSDFARGVFLFGTGLFKKAVISDYISANFVDRVFESPAQYTGLENLFGIYGYAIQIYCDFSGYSEMAIGIALLMGFQFPVNFDSPYQSLSITEFWRRWHISLSSWLRDYLYIPLGGNRGRSWGTWIIPGLFFIITLGVVIWNISQHGAWWMLVVWLAVLLLFTLPPILRRDWQGLATSFNLFSTMLLGGLWHGAANRFLLWGAMHGAGLAAERWWKQLVPGAPGPLRRLLGGLLTFHFVCFCWIFFRAQDLATVEIMLLQIATAFNPQLFGAFLEGYAPVVFWMCIGYFLHFLPQSAVNWTEEKTMTLPLAGKAILIVLIILLVMQVKSSEVQPFIYFQF